MNVSCSNCPAKYAIADEKIRGRKVRITCKHCGTAIVVDGRAIQDQDHPETGRTAKAGEPAGPAPRKDLSGQQAQPIAQRRATKQTVLGLQPPSTHAEPAPHRARLESGPSPTGAAVPRPKGSAPEPDQPSPEPTDLEPKAHAPEPQRRPGPEPTDLEPKARAPEPQRQPALGRRPTGLKPKAPAASPEPEWTVAITDEQQEEMDTAEVVALYAAGTINAETFVWKDSMEDWRTPFEIPKLARALYARGLMPPAETQKQHPIQPSGVWREPGSWNEPRRASTSDDVRFDDVTVAMAAPQAEELLKALEEQPAAASTPSAEEPDDDEATVIRPSIRVDEEGEEVTVAMASPFSAESPVLGSKSARAPAASRPEVGADVLTAAESEDSQPRDRLASITSEGHLTGARNESSVLFSLDALMKPDRAPPPPEEPHEPEDLFGMDQPAKQPAPPRGALGSIADEQLVSAFAAPPKEITPTKEPEPVIERPAPPSVAPAPPEPRGRGWLLTFLLIVGLGGLAAAAFVLRVPKALFTTSRALSAEPPPQLSVPPPTTVSSPLVNTSESGIESQPSAAPAASSAPAPTFGSARPAGIPQVAPSATAASTTATPNAPSTTAAQPARPPFNARAAASALTSAAASAQGCKTPGTPAGSGRVTVTFMPDGRASNAVVTGDYAGTAVGSCVERIFQSAKVPPFSGPKASLSQGFRLN